MLLNTLRACNVHLYSGSKLVLVLVRKCFSPHIARLLITLQPLLPVYLLDLDFYCGFDIFMFFDFSYVGFIGNYVTEGALRAATAHSSILKSVIPSLYRGLTEFLKLDASTPRCISSVMVPQTKLSISNRVDYLKCLHTSVCFSFI